MRGLFPLYAIVPLNALTLPRGVWPVQLVMLVTPPRCHAIILLSAVQNSHLTEESRSKHEVIHLRITTSNILFITC
jgi:hypothetical protein